MKPWSYMVFGKKLATNWPPLPFELRARPSTVDSTRHMQTERTLALDQKLWERVGHVARDEGKTVDELTSEA
jgi:hypothetical protein